MTPLRAIEGALVEASNLLYEFEHPNADRHSALNDAIDKALREVQAWIEEEADDDTDEG